MCDVDDSEYNWPGKTWKGKDGGVHAHSDGTEWADSGQGSRTTTFYILYFIEHHKLMTVILVWQINLCIYLCVIAFGYLQK